MSDYKIGGTIENILAYDLVVSNNDFVLTTGIEESAQAVKFKCLTMTNDLFENVVFGIPYLDDMFSPNIGQKVKALYLERAAMRAPRVTRATVTRFDGGEIDMDIQTSNTTARVRI